MVLGTACGEHKLVIERTQLQSAPINLVLGVSQVQTGSSMTPKEPLQRYKSSQFEHPDHR